MFYGGEEALQLKAKGPYHAVKEPHQHLLQGYPCFFKVCAILSWFESSTGRCCLSTGRCSLSTGRCSLSTGRRGFSTGKCRLSTGRPNFLQEAHVYRKLPVEVWDGQKFVSNGDLAAEEWVGCMHATVGTPEHCCYLAPPSSSPCNQDPCTSKPDQ